MKKALILASAALFLAACSPSTSQDTPADMSGTAVETTTGTSMDDAAMTGEVATGSAVDTATGTMATGTTATGSAQ